MVALRPVQRLRVTRSTRSRLLNASPPPIRSQRDVRPKGGKGGIPPSREVTPKHVTRFYLKRVCVTPSHGSTMTRRYSLRLLGLSPEMPAFQDKCFICQLDLDIRSVLGCHRMSCCGKFIHHRCFHRAHQTSSQCGHCRLMPDEDTSSDDTLRANESLDESDDNPTHETTPAYVTPPELWGPTQIERARTAIADLRHTSYAHTIHQRGTQFWDELPYVIDPMVWYMMWVNLDWFISTNPEGPRPLYIHAAIYLPVQPVQRVRKIIYRLINKTIPDDVWPCLRIVHYRLRFQFIPNEQLQGPNAYPFDPNEITVTHIRFTRFWSPTEYPQDYPYTNDFHPTPPSSP